MVCLQSCFRRRGRVRLQARSRHDGLSSAKFRCDHGRPGAHNRWQPSGRCTAPRFRPRIARHTAAQQCDASSQRQVPGAMLLRCRWLRRPQGSLARPCLQAWSTDTTSNHRSKQRSRARRRTVLITARFWSANNSAPRSEARCMVGTAPTLAHHAVSPGQQTGVSSTGSSN